MDYKLTAAQIDNSLSSLGPLGAKEILMTTIANVASNPGKAVRLLRDDELEAVSGGVAVVDDLLVGAAIGGALALALAVAYVVGEHNGRKQVSCSNGGVPG
jgi:hypothetical protein